VHALLEVQTVGKTMDEKTWIHRFLYPHTCTEALRTSQSLLLLFSGVQDFVGGVWLLLFEVWIDKYIIGRGGYLVGLLGNGFTRETRHCE
jgi:hypothetical protein